MGIQSIIALLCPTCGADLTGFDSDSVFGCSDCAIAWEPKSEGLAGPFPLVQSDHRPEGKVISLPFWQFLLAPLLLPETVTAPTHVYVPAFDLRRRKYFGDPGLHWTLQCAHLSLGPPRRKLVGATLSHHDAERLAHFSVLRAIDVQQDVTGFDLDVALEEPTMLLVSFADRDSSLLDPVSGESYGAAAFCDLPNLREASSEDDL